MKWAVVGLVGLGLLAAVSAVFLINGLKSSWTQSARIGTPGTNGTVLVATRALPAGAKVKDGDWQSQLHSQDKISPDSLSESSQAVGKTLVSPVIAGQAFRKQDFADDDGGLQVAVQLGDGERAVGIPVTDYAGLEGIVYPGSMVDVVASFRNDTDETTRREGPISSTLVENVEVLAVDRQTVTTRAPDPSKNPSATEVQAGRNSTRRVTLKVNTKQAALLSLAMQEGTLTLAMRNPTDATRADSQAISLASMMGLKPAKKAWPGVEHYLERLPPVSAAPAHPTTATTPAPAVAAQPTPAPSPAPAAVNQPQIAKPVQTWDATVIRGSVREQQSFPLDVGDSDGARQ